MVHSVCNKLIDIGQQLLSSLNTRQQATAVWLTTLFPVLLYFRQSVQEAVVSLFETASEKKVVLPLTALLLYSASLVYGLYQLGIWTPSLLIDTILWFIGSAIVLFFKLTQAMDDIKQHFFNVLKHVLHFTVILEFLVGLYTFSFAVEMFFVPSAVMLTVIHGYYKALKPNGPAYTVSSICLSLVGFVLLALTGYGLVVEWQNYATVGQLRSFLSPICLSLGLIPFLYLSAILMAYELIFIKLRMGFEEDAPLRRFAARQIFKTCHISPQKVTAMLNDFVYKLKGRSDKNQVLQAMQDFENRLSAGPIPETRCSDSKMEESEPDEADVRHGLDKKERQEIWQDLIRAEDKARVEADIEYPIVIGDVTAGFTFENGRTIQLDGSPEKQIPPGSRIEIQSREQTDRGLRFYCAAYEGESLLAEGWFGEFWLHNQGLDLTQRNMERNCEYQEQLWEKLESEVLQQYEIDEDVARAITFEPFAL